MRAGPVVCQADREPASDVEGTVVLAISRPMFGSPNGSIITMDKRSAARRKIDSINEEALAALAPNFPVTLGKGADIQRNAKRPTPKTASAAKKAMDRDEARAPTVEDVDAELAIASSRDSAATAVIRVSASRHQTGVQQKYTSRFFDEFLSQTLSS